jgi:hypothetical protein
MSLDIMLSRPGVYVVITWAGLMFVEVDDAGRCFQLTLDDYRRDGELRAGGWMQGNISAIHGPFARSPARQPA